MAGGVSLGAIFARLGLDSSQFQGGLAGAGSHLSRFEQETKRTGVSMSASLTPSFGVAALMAQQFGGAIKDASAGIADMIGASPNLTNALATLSTSGVLAASSYGRLSLSVKDMAKAGPDAALAMGNLALASFQLGNSIGKLALEQFPELGRIVSTLAEGPTKLFGEQLAGNEALFRTTSNTLLKLREQLGLTGAEWRVSADRTRENAIRLAELYDRALMVKRGLSGLSEVAANAGKAVAGLGAASLASLSDAAKAVKGLRGEYDVLTAPDVKMAMLKLTADFQQLAAQGVSAGQLMAAFGDRVAEIRERAKEYTDLRIPDEFKRLADAVDGSGGSVAAVEALAKSLASTLPTAAGSGTAASKKALEDLGEQLKDSISGGFGMGAEEGTNFARQQYDKFLRETEGKRIPVRFQLDVEDLQRQLADAAAGAIARTGGRV